jgi:hypothetical protein
MSDEQRTLAGYKSKVHEQGEFENPNEGKPVLSDTEEYIIRLTSFPKVKSFQQIKEKKDGTRTTVSVDKAICEFEEESHHNRIMAFMNVGSLNFSEDEAYESAVIRFFKKIGAPLPDGVEPEWDKHFIVGMRFRGRVVVGKDAEKKPNASYYLDIPTCRPLLQSDKHPDAVAAMKDQPPTDANPAPSGALLSVENIKFIIHGAKDLAEGTLKLVEAGVHSTTIQTYLAAVKNGKITFPV